MKLKTATWNIGGGKLLEDNSDPALIASYTKDGLDFVADLLKSEAPDVITLQETQRREGYDQVAIVAKSLGYGYYFHDSTSDSHIDTDCRLGHAVISRYPISQHHFGFFNNPRVQVLWEDGSIATSFDKGFSSCVIELGGKKIEVVTLHLIPFRRFDIKIDSPQAEQILHDVADKIMLAEGSLLIQGDFNIDDAEVSPHLHSLFDRERLEEVIIDEPTTPKGRSYDHVLYRGLKFESKRIISKVKTDHYPVICEFEI